MFAINSTRPRSQAASCAPATIAHPHGAVAMRSETSPIVSVRERRNPLATRSRRYPRSSATATTRSLVAEAILASGVLLSTSDTVARETPAASATSCIDGRASPWRPVLAVSGSSSRGSGVSVALARQELIQRDRVGHLTDEATRAAVDECYSV